MRRQKNKDEISRKLSSYCKQKDELAFIIIKEAFEDICAHHRIQKLNISSMDYIRPKDNCHPDSIPIQKNMSSFPLKKLKKEVHLRSQNNNLMNANLNIQSAKAMCHTKQNYSLQLDKCNVVNTISSSGHKTIFFKKNSENDNRHHPFSSSKMPSLKTNKLLLSSTLLSPPIDNLYSIQYKRHTNKFFKFTNRIEISSREISVNSSIIIINFEGVLGDIILKPQTSRIPKKVLYIRKDSILCLSMLCRVHRVVLITRLNSDLVLKIKCFYEANGVKFDAIYQHKPVTQYSDYSQIYFDFNILTDEVSSKVLILGCLNLSINDIEAHANTSLLDLIVTGPSLCSKRWFHTYNVQ